MPKESNILELAAVYKISLSHRVPGGMIINRKIWTSKTSLRFSCSQNANFTGPSTMNGEFGYYNPALNHLALEHEANVEPPMCREVNNFGTNYPSQCEYQGAPQDYENLPQYCETIPRRISTARISHQLQIDPVESRVPTTETACINKRLSSSGKSDFGRRDISNSKRSRTVFQPHQLRRLQYEFQREMYMVGMKRRNLSKELDLSEKQIKIWFQNRRMKEKREHNRKRHRGFGNVQNGRIARDMYSGEFGGCETLRMSNSCNMNNPQMLML